MKTIRTTPEKILVQNIVTEAGIALQKKYRTIDFVTLSDGDISHEKDFLGRVPCSYIYSCNFNQKIAQDLQRQFNKERLSAEGIWTRLGGENDPMLLGSDTPTLWWHDYCNLASVFVPFFDFLKNVPFRDVVFVTFGASHVWGWKELFKEIPGATQAKQLKEEGNRADRLADEIILESHKRAKILGWKPFKSVKYTVKGGRMITIGFKKSGAPTSEIINLNSMKNTTKKQNKKTAAPLSIYSTDAYSAIVKGVAALRAQGITAHEIAEAMGASSAKVAGLFRAATVRGL